MPQNFRDAIIFTRKLNLQYLWIDSICIIQDDRNDWKIQAAKMHRVYSWAYLTVAATSSKSTHQGFLGTRSGTQERITMPYRSHEDGLIHGNFYLDPQFRRVESGSSEIRGSTCNTRGWTFQERLLSARILHFCERRLCSECRCSDWTEDNLESDGTQQACWLKMESDSSKVWVNRLPEKEPQRTYQTWYLMIRDYTEREFTFDGDVLPAILGLVDEMKTIIEDDCFWGLWHGDFPRGLLWCKAEPLDSGTGKGPTYLSKPSTTRAPSWSWISLNGRITWHRHQYNTETRFGLSLQQCVDSERPPKAEPWAIRVQTRIRKLSACVDAGPGTGEWPYQLLCEELDIGKGFSDVDGPPLAGRQIWIMEVESDHTSARKSHEANCLAALLLEPYNGIPDKFCRVGFALRDEDSRPFEQCPLQTISLY